MEQLPQPWVTPTNLKTYLLEVQTIFLEILICEQQVHCFLTVVAPSPASYISIRKAAAWPPPPMSNNFIVRWQLQPPPPLVTSPWEMLQLHLFLYEVIMVSQHMMTCFLYDDNLLSFRWWRDRCGLIFPVHCHKTSDSLRLVFYIKWSSMVQQW